MKINNVGAIKVAQKTGKEQFTYDSKPVNANISDFWKWFASNLVTNSLRGVLAEFIVALSIGKTKDIRLEWDAVDLITDSGIGIEVKSSAYIQSWAQESYSKISFGIQQTKGWDAKTNIYTGELKRYSDVYVFCVLYEKDQDKINPLDLDQWDFYVLPTKVLDEGLGNQATLTLDSLLKRGPVKTDFFHLKNVIEQSVKTSDS